MRAFLLNYDARPDRLERASAELRRVGIEFEPVITGRQSTECGHWSLGIHSVFLSHWSVVRRAVENKWQRTLIFEDDVLLRDDALTLLYNGLAELSGVEWDCLWLGGSISSPPEKFSAHLLRLGYVSDTHAYCLSYDGACRVNELFAELNGRVDKPPFDVFIGARLKNKFHLDPIAAIQADGYSDNFERMKYLSQCEASYFRYFDQKTFRENRAKIQSPL